MTEAVVVHTDLPVSRDAGLALGWQISEAMTASPDAVILFASPAYDHTQLLHAIKKACHPKLLIGSSSAGEFTSNVHGEGLACAVALRSPEMQFRAGIGRGLRSNHAQAAQDIASSFHSCLRNTLPFRSALVLVDALAGRTEELVEHLTQLTGGTHQFFGGGSGDNGQFRETPVFYDTEVVSDAVVALEILSAKPLGIGVRHGWQPASQAMYVTKANGPCLISLDDRPAVEAFQAYAHEIRQRFDPATPLPFFLHNLLGIELGIGYKLRMPLSVNPDGSLLCAADIPEGATVYIMGSSTNSAVEAAESATRGAIQKLCGYKPALALLFDCVATRLKLEQEFKLELEGVQRVLGPTRYVGCNTHGQIARAEGQFSAFHNCTAVVCLIPD
ncbi:MAG: FIST C-terminal domain-containing protein [Ktedonobacteraceae bacterium]|nr:FIST C-terminal domain-containing protein [Ktedonobacteraceae bacterium]